ncbi:MAG: lysophospholipid acyltransferase family protein [Deltaproteobacteria bacterium]|nr:lysophospholipid acyltransferase family protein [Deltaproteobacteria bacterium]
MTERIYRAILRLAEAIPLPVRAILFETIMLCVWAVDAKHRRIGRVNLRIAFPGMTGREAARIVRLCYVRMGTSAAEFVQIPRIDADYIRSRFRIEGKEHPDRSVSETGLGPLCVTGHFGNWELLSHSVGTLFAPVAFIVRPLKNPVFDRIVTERRTWTGNRVLAKVDSAKEVIRELRRGTLVGILIDQNVDRPHGVAVDFFTRKAYTTHGIARIALATGARIHPAFIFRDPADKFRHIVKFGPAIPVNRNASRDEEVERILRRCNEELEKAIREDPTQWLWFHRRWKTRPPGEPAVYEE